MAKWIKVIVASVIAAPVVAAIAVATLVEPNDYKPQLEKLVSDNTGRGFEIAGDIGLSFFPWLGFEVEGLTLANNPDFSAEPMMTVGRAEARLKLLPLFMGQLEIGLVALQDLTVVAGIDRSGGMSWDDMVAASEEATAETNSDTDASTELPAFTLSAFEISNASLKWLDKPAKNTTVITPFELTIGQIVPGKPFNLEAKLAMRQGEGSEAMAVDAELETQVTLNTEAQQISMSPFTLEADIGMAGLKPIAMELKASIQAALDGSQAVISDISGEVNDLDIKGHIKAASLTATPMLDVVLQLGTLNIDSFVVSSDAGEAESATGSAAATTAELNKTVVDVSALNGVNANVDLSANKFMASGLEASNFVMQAKLKSGLLNISKMNLDLYEGSFKATAKVNAAQKPASFYWQHNLASVNAEPLQEDMMDKAYIAGTAAMTTEINTRGATVGALKKAMSGSGKLEFANGALKGINVAGALRKAFAAYKKQPLPENDTEVLDTDFSAATASFTIANGVLNNPDMLVVSPLIRITGSGTVNLVDETVDYRAKPVVVASLEGQGASSLDDMDGLPIPVRCTGALAEPKCRTDFGGMLKGQADAALEKEKAELEAKLDEEKAKAKADAKAKLEEKAKDLLNKWR